MKTENTAENIYHFLRMLQRPSKRLSDWELKFVDKMDQIFNQTGHLTDNQFYKLEEIYAAKTD